MSYGPACLEARTEVDSRPWASRNLGTTAVTVLGSSSTTGLEVVVSVRCPPAAAASFRRCPR